MKYILSVLLLWVILFNSCKNEENKKSKINNTSHLKSDSLKLEFDFPNTWKPIKNPKNPNVIFIQEPLQDSNDIFNENIYIWTEQLPMKVADSVFHLAAITELKIQNDSLKIENKGKLTMNKNIFNHYSFHFSPLDKKKYIVKGYTLYNAKDSFGYYINATMLQENEKEFSEKVETILKTFKIR